MEPRRIIGPYPLMAGVLFIRNPLTIIGAILLGFSLIPSFVDISSWPDFARIAFYYAAKYHGGTIGISLMGVGIVMAGICFSTSLYAIEDNGLVVTHGIFSPYSRRGFFTGDTNGVAFNMIMDADPGRSLLQMFTNSGTLYVVTMEHERVIIPFVHAPEEIRQVIMSKAGIIRARPITRIGGIE